MSGCIFEPGSEAFKPVASIPVPSLRKGILMQKVLVIITNITLRNR